MPEYSFKFERLVRPGDSLFEAQDDLCCKSPLRSPVSTGNVSITKPSETVLKAAASGLKYLYFGEGFMNRLQGYSDDTFKIPGLRNVFRASDLPLSRNLPPTKQVIQALAGIARKEQELHFHKPPPLTNKSSVLHEAHVQIFDYLNLLIKIKEVNTALLTPNIPIDTPTKTVTQSFYDTRGREVDRNKLESVVFTPYWGQNSSSHLEDLNPLGVGQSGPKPGSADFTLFRNPSLGRTNQPGCAEVKSPWNYSTRDMIQIYRGHPNVIDEHNMFRFTRSKKAANLMLEQVYGELAALASDIGFFTNMDIVFFYLIFDVGDSKPGDSPPWLSPNSGLILSPVLNFEDPRVLKCLQGLTYLALDREKWRAAGKSLVDILAPIDELSLITQAAGLA
ncbi:hypothetical protein F5050DRAFT_1581629 [Lentinula boryana]|uniref:Fungal-type protein kinase domain-containing protein n=1 Tax=Lentinula boryana TaxID=40481 RepID=A0ABQ8PXY6_9AGAR|nr:hypothetical protein F5050DRAFT_1581629 [Lentinula boryana]